SDDARASKDCAKTRSSLILGLTQGSSLLPSILSHLKNLRRRSPSSSPRATRPSIPILFAPCPPPDRLRWYSLKSSPLHPSLQEKLRIVLDDRRPARSCCATGRHRPWEPAAHPPDG